MWELRRPLASIQEQTSLSTEDDKEEALKIMNMRSSGRENGGKIILKDKTRKYKVQSIESMAESLGVSWGAKDREETEMKLER